MATPVGAPQNNTHRFINTINTHYLKVIFRSETQVLIKLLSFSYEYQFLCQSVKPLDFAYIKFSCTYSVVKVRPILFNQLNNSSLWVSPA